MVAIASQITSLTIVYWTVHSGAYQWKQQSSASLAFVWGIHRWPVNSPHKWPVTRKMFLFDDVIMNELMGWEYLSQDTEFMWNWFIHETGSWCQMLMRHSTPKLLRDFAGFRRSFCMTSPNFISVTESTDTWKKTYTSFQMRTVSAACLAPDICRQKKKIVHRYARNGIGYL